MNLEKGFQCCHIYGQFRSCNSAEDAVIDKQDASQTEDNEVQKKLEKRRMFSPDSILQHLGGYGRFQICVYLAICYVYMRSTFHTLGSIFMGADPGHHCRIPSNFTLNQTIPREEVDGVLLWSKCEMYSEPDIHNTTEPCVNGWMYGDVFDQTILTEWDLVCSHASLVDMSSTIYMAGSACGAMFVTPLSDLFGRKIVMLTCLFFQTLVGIGLTFVNTYTVFALLRCVIGLLNMVISLTGYVLMTEIFDAKRRTTPSIAINMFWALGEMILALMGFLIRDWRYLNLAITLPNLLTVIYIWYLPESIIWLISNRQFKKAECVLKRAANQNKLKLPDGLTTDLSAYFEVDNKNVEQCNNVSPEHKASEFTLSQQQLQTPTTEEPSSQNLLSKKKKKTFFKKHAFILFRSTRMRRYTLIVFYLSFVNNISYFGNLFNTPALHGNLFFNLFLSGVVEIPAILIAMLVINRVGRRIPICVFLLICGLTNLSLLFIPKETESETSLLGLSTGMAMVGKFGITGSYSVMWLFASEIFPTSVRNHAVGLSSTCENIGGILAPLIVYGAKVKYELPLGIFGGLTLIGGLLVLLLPETNKKPLPETIEEIESWGNRK